MPKDKNVRPKTGRKAESELTSLLKRLSSGEPDVQVPSMPDPLFDRSMGGLFREKKKKN